MLIFLLSLLILPISLQIVNNWLYSNVYVYSLFKNLTKEFKIFERARTAKDATHFPEAYNAASTNALYNQNSLSKEDNRIACIEDLFIERLKTMVKEIPLRKLLWNGLEYILMGERRLLLMNKTISLKGEEVKSLDHETQIEN